MMTEKLLAIHKPNVEAKSYDFWDHQKSMEWNRGLRWAKQQKVASFLIPKS
jgi:hypothetical protein